MASSPITTWQIDGETMEIMADLIFFSSKSTAYGDCSHKIKRRLFLGKTIALTRWTFVSKAMSLLFSIAV